VGIPSGRSFPSGFGIHTRRTGFARYFDHLIARAWMASYFCSARVQITLSAPRVLRPPFVHTRLIAIALASKEVRISLCIALISQLLAPDFKAPYNLFCSDLKSFPAFRQLILFQFITFYVQTVLPFRIMLRIMEVPYINHLYVRFALIPSLHTFVSYDFILCPPLQCTVRFLERSSAH
jgi:hypothetical protein